YMGFMRERVKEIHRVLKKHGVIFVHCDWRTCHHQRLMLDEIFGAEGFVNHLVWVYGLGGSSPRRFARKHDDVLFYAKGPKYFFKAPMVRATSQRMKGMMKKAIDVIEVASINNMARERTGYPTQKPVELMEVLVRACCPEGGMVMDPFCGSGSTLEAAVRNGRMCIGIDRNTSAVRITKRRLGL
ncbi:MAG TPA: site-specific DNA-methyltransferase, partial [Phycisphaerales bacterium]|nr:site-specific DNA-methyltransferase [Phycisphaerales bacterium]